MKEIFNFLKKVSSSLSFSHIFSFPILPAYKCKMLVQLLSNYKQRQRDNIIDIPAPTAALELHWENH